MRIQKWSLLKLLIEKLCSKYVFIYLTYVSYIKLFLTFVPYIFCYLYTYIIPVYIFPDVYLSDTEIKNIANSCGGTLCTLYSRIVGDVKMLKIHKNNAQHDVQY